MNRYNTKRKMIRKVWAFVGLGTVLIFSSGCGTAYKEKSSAPTEACAPASSLNITMANFVRFKTQSSCGFDLMHIALESPSDLSKAAVSVDGVDFDYDTRGLEEPGWYWFNSDAILNFVIGETYTVEIDGKSICATLVVGQC